ncbi:MAG: hypothetical protein NT011_04100 [Kiritimatiellaeota bacterium]|nr:hypothetical protein [Kiritimatiellota bacterium]
MPEEPYDNSATHTTGARRNGPWVMGLGFLVFAIALAVYLEQSRYLVRNEYRSSAERSFLFGGDEPWYLLTTRSIALRLDYNFYHDLEEHGFLEFWNRDVTPAQYGFQRNLKLGRGEAATPEFWAQKRYPIVRIGLPILLAPAYRAGLAWDGHIRLLCVWCLCLIGALLVQQMFLAGYELTRNRMAALAGALAGGFSVPILLYTTQIYTELASALLLMFAVRMLFMSAGPPVWRALGTGLAVAALPWLHDKYYLLAALLVAAGVVQWRRGSFATLTALLIPVLVTLSLQGAYYYSLHRVIYPVTDHGALSIKTGLCGGWLGLLVDRTDGLFVYWPAALIALGGLVLLWRKNRKIGGWLTALVTAHWLVSGLFPVWTGGPVAPLRYWLPVIPLLVIASTVALAFVRTRTVLIIVLLCMGLSIGIGFYNSAHPRRWFGNALPLASTQPRIERVLEGVWQLFPDMKKPVAVDYAKGTLWVLILGSGIIALGRQRLTRT